MVIREYAKAPTEMNISHNADRLQKKEGKAGRRHETKSFCRVPMKT